MSYLFFDTPLLTLLKSIDALRQFDKIFLISDPHALAQTTQWQQDLLSAGIPTDLLELHITESDKSIHSALLICAHSMDRGLTRKSLIVAAGGGVLGDTVGLAAHLYRRGCAWMCCPTTLLSQADSCYGGKTGVNFRGIKNVLGTFYSPVAICCHQEFLKTLSVDDLIAGVGEIVKMTLLFDKARFFDLTHHLKDLLQSRAFTPYVRFAVEQKKALVDQDPLEADARKILNFGHTFGHAFESILGLGRLPHGQAVLIGIIAECALAKHAGRLPADTFTLIKQTLEDKVFSCYPKLKSLTSKVKKICLANMQELTQILQQDKKNAARSITFISLQDFEAPIDITNPSIDIMRQALMDL